VLHFGVVEQAPVALVGGAVDVLELAVAVELVLRDLRLLYFGGLLDHLLLCLFLWTHPLGLLVI